MRISRQTALLLVLAALPALACGGSDDSASPDAAADGGEPITAPAEAWTWVPIGGMKCADGSSTGVGVNLTDASDDVMILMAGGGACWDEASCVTTPSSVHISGGYGEAEFDEELAGLAGFGLFQRADGNPMKEASYVYVPYCTGDLHDGSNVATYGSTQIHHVGRPNAAALMGRLAATRLSASTVWMIGGSAGGYGVSLTSDLARASWPEAEVHVLADSSQFVALAPSRWSAMVDSWKPTFPSGCSTCASDFGAVNAALRDSLRPGERYGLLAYTRDSVLIDYFEITPEEMEARTLAAQAAMSTSSGQAALVLAGTGHVVLGNPTAETSQGVSVLTWVLRWATGDPAWTSSGP